jgi:putative transposase
MSRPLRILIPGAYYHVMNRGRSRDDVFIDERDCKTFLGILRHACSVCNVDVVAFL